MNFKDKVVLVTGSTSGIGLEIATQFAKKNANIIFNGMGKKEDIAHVKETLDSLGQGNALFHGADLTKVDEIEDLIHFAKKNFGRLDILINNAGMQHVSPIEDFGVGMWDKIIALNLTASFHTIRLALPIMRVQNYGRIINMASTHGLVASAGKSAYVATKHGILGLTKVVALETAEVNITCNAVCPGFVLTPLVEAQIRDTMKISGKNFEEASAEFVGDKHASKKFIPVEDIGAACLYLASDHASQIKGTQIILDGGWVAQ